MNGGAYNLGKVAGEAFYNLGFKAPQRIGGSLGQKISHQATRTLGQVNTAANVAAVAATNPLVKAIAAGTAGGARVGSNLIEMGKDLDVGGFGTAGGKSGMEKAKKRIPAIMRDAAEVGAAVEMGAMFL